MSANFMLTDPINETTSKNRQVDVFLFVFVSADNPNVSALLNTDLFMKNWVGQTHAADPKAAYDSKKKIRPSRFSLVFVKAVLPSVSALTPLQKKSRVPENSYMLIWVGSLHVRRPNHAPILKKGQVDVFPLVFVSAANINVSTLLNTDFFY